MKVRSIHGDDEINDALTGAMQATVSALVQDGLLDVDTAGKFLDKHICILAHESALRRWYRRFTKDTESRIIVAEMKPCENQK